MRLHNGVHPLGNQHTTLSAHAHHWIARQQLDLLIDQHEVVPWSTLLPQATIVRLRGYPVMLPFPADYCSLLAAPYLYLEQHAESFCCLLVESVQNEPRQYLSMCWRCPQEKLFLTLVLHAIASVLDAPTLSLYAMIAPAYTQISFQEVAHD